MSVSIREAIYNLRTPPLPGKKFLPRLRDYLASYRSSYGLSIRLETSIDEEFDISEIVAVQLMRIIQEALSNIRKHAGCTQSWIRLRQNTEHLHVFIEDDGRGLSAARSEDGQKDHYGIQIMKERAGSVGGSVIVKPRPERGTCVCVDVPIDFLPQRH